MTNFKILVKYNFLKFINVFRGKNKNKPIKSGVILMVLACLGILAIYTLQAYLMFLGLAPLGLAAVCMFHAYMIAIIVLAIFSIMRITANKKSEDDDFLISLPLTKSQIILSKSVTRYLLDFAISFVLIIPFLINDSMYSLFLWAFSVWSAIFDSSFCFIRYGLCVYNVLDYCYYWIWNCIDEWNSHANGNGG